MYILKYPSRHVVRGNKEGMAPKIPDPSCTRRNLCVSHPGFLCSHISSLCRAVRHCPYYSLFSSPSSQSTLQHIDSWPEVSYWREQHPDQPGPPWGCVSSAFMMWVRNIAVCIVHSKYSRSQPPTYTLGSHLITQCWDWWVLLSNFEILQTSFLKQNVIFLRSKMSLITSC